MLAVQEHAGDKVFEIPLVKRLAQIGEVVLVAQVRGCQLIVVQPSAQRRHGKCHAVGNAEVTLAHNELGTRKRRFHQRMVKPACSQARQLVVHHAAQALRCVCGKPAQLDDGKGLLHGIGKVGLYVFGQARVKQCALQRRLVAAGNGIKQNVGGNDTRALAHVPDYIPQPHAGVFRRGLHGALHAERAHGRLFVKRARRKRLKARRCAFLGALFLLSGNGR